MPLHTQENPLQLFHRTLFFKLPLDIINVLSIPELDDLKLDEIWFQQDDATVKHKRATNEILCSALRIQVALFICNKNAENCVKMFVNCENQYISKNLPRRFSI